MGWVVIVLGVGVLGLTAWTGWVHGTAILALGEALEAKGVARQAQDSVPAQVQEVKEALEALDRKVAAGAGVQAEMSEVRETLGALDRKGTGVEAVVSEVQDILGNVTMDLDGLAARVGVLNQRLTELIVPLVERVEHVEQHVASWGDRGAVDGLAASLGRLEAEVTAVTSRVVTDLVPWIEGLQQLKTAHGEWVETFQQWFHGVDAFLESLHQQHGEMGRSLQALDDRVSVNAERVEGLARRIEGLV